MPRDRDAILDLDPRTARIGRELYADVRRKDASERAALRGSRSAAADGPVDAGDGPLSWLFGGAGETACHGGHGDGGNGGCD